MYGLLLGVSVAAASMNVTMSIQTEKEAGDTLQYMTTLLVLGWGPFHYVANQGYRHVHLELRLFQLILLGLSLNLAWTCPNAMKVYSAMIAAVFVMGVITIEKAIDRYEALIDIGNELEEPLLG